MSLSNDMLTQVEVEEHSSSLACEVVRSFEAAAGIEEEWDQFIRNAGGDLYMTWDWCRLWWQFYGTRRQLRILLLRAGTRLVGIVPLFIERVWLGPIWIKVAKLIGADSSLTLCNPPVDPQWAKAVFERVLEHAIGQERCDALAFGPLAGPYPCSSALREAAAGNPGRWLVARDQEVGVHTTFELPATFDAYLGKLGSKQRGNYRKRKRLLEGGRQIDVQVVSDPEQGEREFEAFCRMHEAQWTTRGKLGHFGDWPGATEFNRALARRMGERGYLRIARMTADGETIAYQYGFVFNRCWFARFTARVEGEQWDKMGLGALSILAEFARLMDIGVQRVESGMGHYDYKLEWGGKEHPVRSMLVVARGASAQLRARCFDRLARLLHLLYYRVWFLKLAPRLPLRRRPLWRLWIRSRL